MKEKINNIKITTIQIFNKIKYPLEFIFSLLFILGIFKFITVKNYEGYWSREILIYLCFIGLITLTIFIYNCIKDKNKIENIFLNFAIPIGLMYMVFMLPTYTPDAGAHIWKSYELSEGILLTEIDENGQSLTTVPEVLSTYRETTLTKYNVLIDLMDLPEAYDYNLTTQLDTPAKSYSSIFYIFYAIAFAIARLFNLNIYVGVFLARILNYIIVLMIQYMAIKKIPFGKLFLAVYILMPMALQQSTAISVDSIMNAMIILFIAYALNLTFKKEKIKIKEIIIFLLLTIFVGLSKLTYVPLIGIGLILAKHRKDLSIKQKIIVGILTVVVCLGSLFIITQMTKRISYES